MGKMDVIETKSSLSFCLETFCRDLPDRAKQLQRHIGHSFQASDHNLGQRNCFPISGGSGSA